VTDVDRDTFVSVVAPVRNDGDIVDAFIAETLEVLQAHFARFELILVDDDSTDDTVRRVTAWLPRSAGLRLMRLSRSFGTEIAISAGLETTIGDVVVVALLETDPPARIPDLVARARGGAGLVFGVRATRQGQAWVQRTGARLFYWLCNDVLQLRIPPHSTHFRALSRPVVNAVLQIRDQLRYLRTLGGYVGYDNDIVVYTPIARRSPPRRMGVVAAVRLALGIIVSNSLAPLIAGAAVAGVTMLASFGWLSVLLVRRVTGGTVPVGDLMLAALGGVLAFLLGIVCTYLGRLLSEARGRPLYFVREERAGTPSLGEAGERNVVSESTTP
jgi:polyisoprenyl-phosphate glycosyltransferase